MTREELVTRCRRAHDVGEVKHEEFADYITLIERRRKGPQGWTTDETPYMSVDGRLAMANADHRRQGRKLRFENPIVLTDTEEQLTIMVIIESEVYGRRHGIATSRRADGSPIEMQHPWEIAETSAMGRALAAMGYGLLPGTGLASAEDMIRSGERPVQALAARLSDRQRAYLVSEYTRSFGASAADAEQALGKACVERFGHDLSQCTADEGREVSLWLRRRGNDPVAAAESEAA